MHVESAGTMTRATQHGGKHAKSRAEAPAVESPSELPRTPLRVGSFLLEQSMIACNRGRYEMAVDLPSSHRVLGSGRSAQEAFVDFCTQVSSLLFVDPTAPSPDTSKSAAEDFDALREMVERRDADVAPNRTKTRQKTVGVTSKASLVDQMSSGLRYENFATLARDLFEKGLGALDSRLDRESSQIVFDDFQSAYAVWPDTATQQWMLRIDRRTYQHALVLANEYGRSLSNLAAICIAYALRK